ncbi:MAG: hypothetical protein JSW11_21825 [Candidatus Heimdallarchaeota archaeon]|nr:MAG: hypothetical protein JSW11_21825 [Candidatus Heimdallarchaeota archaeon]
MSYQDTMNSLIQNGYVSIVTILDANGGTYWTNQPDWQVNGASVLNAWKNKEPGVTIAGTRFSTIMNEWDTGYLVARNVGGAGIIVVARAPNGYYFLTWTPGDVQIPPLNIHAEVSRMAALFK